MTVPKEGVSCARGSNGASLPGVYFARGKRIAMVRLVAGHPTEEGEEEVGVFDGCF